MAYPEPRQEPYTKYPNRYNDIIKPRLTGAQRDICDVVIRMNYGWHETTAEISNTVFARKANKSKQGIIKAKKQLEEMGLLIVSGKGGGSRTNSYMLDLWYDNPDRSVKASMLRQEEQLLEMLNQPPQEKREDILELLETPAIDEPTTFEEPGVEMATPPSQEERQDIRELAAAPPIEEPQPAIEEDPHCNIPEPQAIESENHTPEEPDSERDNPDTELTENPVRIEVSAAPTSKLSLPPFKEDLSININTKERKHTEEHAEKPKKEKKATATVRFQFLSLFPETKADDDWQFFGWVAKEYGLETCLAKLDYMKEHRKQHSIANPKGFFRTALVRNFQPTAFVVAKLKADEQAKRAKEKSQKESEEWQQRTTNFNYGAATASLQKLLDNLN